MRLINGSGKRAGRSELPPSAAAVERHIGSIFAKLGHNDTRPRTAELPPCSTT